MIGYPWLDLLLWVWGVGLFAAGVWTAERAGLTR